MSSEMLIQVLAATYRNDLRPILVLRDGSARRVFIDDRSVLIGTYSRWWDRQYRAVVAIREDDTHLSRSWKLFWLGSVANAARGRCNLVPSTQFDDDAGESVLDTLKFVQVGFWHACVEIVNSRTDHSACDGFRGICRRSSKEVSQFSDLKITCTTDVVDMFIEWKVRASRLYV